MRAGKGWYKIIKKMFQKWKDIGILTSEVDEITNDHNNDITKYKSNYEMDIILMAVLGWGREKVL